MPKTEVRRLLKQQRSERQKEKRVEHPFAKYDTQDQLTCIVCNSQVKSAWSAHLGSAFHKENMARLRALKQQKQQPQQQRPVKRTSSPVPDQQEPSIKRAKHHEQEDEEMDDDENDNNETSQLPADFFDAGAAPAPQQSSSESEEEEEPQRPSPPKKEQKKTTQPPQQQQSGAASNLPQGFFDDPEEEARMRKEAPIAEQVDNILDEEYALFKEAMADTIIEAEKVDEEEDEELWLDRDEEMFRQQAEFDSRVEMLKKMRAKTAQGEFSAPSEEERAGSRGHYDDTEREIRTGLKTGVRNVLKKAPAKKVATVFDDMDISSDEEDEEENDWRAQQL